MKSGAVANAHEFADIGLRSSVLDPDEGVAITESAIKVASSQLRPTRHSVLVLVDRWMLNQVAALGAFISDEMSRALAQACDSNVFIGDGSPTYARTLGVFNQTAAPHLVTTADAGDDTYQEVCDGTVHYLSQVVGAIPESTELFDPKFYMHRSMFFAYLGARDSNNRPMADFVASDTGKPQRTIWGYPCEVTQVAPKLSDASQANKVMFAFGALGRAWIGVRSSQIEIRTSEHVKFAEGQIALLLDVVMRYQEIDPNVMSLMATHS